MRETIRIYADAQVVNVHTLEVQPRDILTAGGRILAVLQPGEATQQAAALCQSLGTADAVDTIECTGLFALPGLMDAHFHTESTLLSLPETAQLLSSRGTTAVFANPHEIANVLGVSGVRHILDDARDLPIRVFLVAPCQVPTAPGLETTGATFTDADVLEMLSWPETVGAGEFSAFDLADGGTDRPTARLARAVSRAGKVVCGHAPGARGDLLQRAMCAGMRDDHESQTVPEVLEKLRAGLTVFLREGTTEQNLVPLLRGILAEGLDPGSLPGLAMCTDDKHANDLVHRGHLDHCLALAVGLGVAPAVAVRLATLNCAKHYGLTNLGAVAPGYDADMTFVRNLTTFDTAFTVCRGRLFSPTACGDQAPTARGPAAEPASSLCGYPASAGPAAASSARGSRRSWRCAGVGSCGTASAAALGAAAWPGLQGIPAHAPGGAARREPLDIVPTQAHGGLLTQAPSGEAALAVPGRFVQPPLLSASDEPNWVNTGSLGDLESRLCLTVPIDLPKGAARASAVSEGIGVLEGHIVTRRVALRTPPLASGTEVTPRAFGPGVNKVAVLDRYLGSGRLGLALTVGFGLHDAAIGSSVAHDHHNFVVVGDGDGNIAATFRAMQRMRGGLVVVAAGRVVAVLPLPVAGLMTNRPAKDVVAALDTLNAAASAAGCPLKAPFMTLSFVTLPVVPELGVTDMGLIDVALMKVIPWIHWEVQ